MRQWWETAQNVEFLSKWEMSSMGVCATSKTVPPIQTVSFYSEIIKTRGATRISVCAFLSLLQFDYCQLLPGVQQKMTAQAFKIKWRLYKPRYWSSLCLQFLCFPKFSQNRPPSFFCERRNLGRENMSDARSSTRASVVHVRCSSCVRHAPISPALVKSRKMTKAAGRLPLRNKKKVGPDWLRNAYDRETLDREPIGTRKHHFLLKTSHKKNSSFFEHPV